MYQVRPQRAGGAAGCRILRNVIPGRKHARVRPCFTNFNRFTSERFAAGSTYAFVDFSEQGGIDTTATEISQRANRDRQERQAGGDNLNRKSFVKVFYGQTQRPCDLRLLVWVVNLTVDLKLSLRHYHLHRHAIFEFDVNRKDTNADFMMNARPAIATFGERDNSFARQRVPRTDNWMPGKRNFACGREDSETAQH